MHAHIIRFFLFSCHQTNKQKKHTPHCIISKRSSDMKGNKKKYKKEKSRKKVKEIFV